MSATALPPTFESTAGWEPCSDRSLERGDPLAGTGGFGARWLLIEIDGAWGAHAFFQSRLAHASYTAGPPLVWPESPAAEAITNLSPSARP